MRMGGYLLQVSFEGKKTEHDTITCAHCNRIVILVPKKECFGTCLMCYKPICLNCTKVGKCLPFEEKLNRIEARDQYLRYVNGSR